MKEPKNSGLALIKKSNNLIEARYKFDIWETRFFLSVLAQISKEDEDFKRYRILYKEIVKTFDISTNRSYELLREGAKSLMKKPLYTSYEINGQHRERQYHIIRSIDYLDDNPAHSSQQISDGEYIDVTVDPDMKPLLLQLREQGGFTFYELNNVVKLGVYSLRVYELLKQYQKIGSRTLDVEEMRLMFELTTEYPLFANFYQRIIEPARKEINRFSDLYIETIERKKLGKKVVALTFKFYNKVKTTKELAEAQEAAQALMTSEKETPTPIDPIATIPTAQAHEKESPENSSTKDALFLHYQATVVGAFGVSPSTFLAALDHSDSQAIEKAIRVTERMHKEGKLKNLSGFFVEALRKGYIDEAEAQAAKKQQQAEERERKRLLTAELEQHLLSLAQSIKDEENATIRLLVAADATLTQKAIDWAIVQISGSTFLTKKLLAKGYDNLVALDVQTWRDDALLREKVIEGIKALVADEFQYILPLHDKKARLERQLRALMS